jgi:hypothetical protein
MPGLLLAALAGLCVTSYSALGADAKVTAPALSVSQIIDKHLAARGGAAGWHATQAISWSGKMEIGSGDSAERSNRFLHSGSMPSSHKELVGESAGQSQESGPKQVQVPFTLTMERPHKTRLELVIAGRTAVQVYDGTQGWKVRPYLNRNDAEPFSPEELKLEQAREALDGPLVDYTAKGTRVDLDGVEAVEGKPAYKLKLTHKDGTVQHIWIDAKSFLDVKVEGNPRRMDGGMHNVYVYQRDFRSVQGLVIPFELETVVDGYSDKHRIMADTVTVNPKLAANAFAKPMPGPAAARPAGAARPPGAPSGKGA